MDHFDVRVRNEGAATSAAAARAATDPAGAVGRTTGGDADEAIGWRLRAREPAALAELYRLHRRRAFGLAYRVLGDGAAAEDAVQAAFLALWERAPRLEPRGGRIASLLMTIVHRRAVDLARSRSRDRARRAPSSADDPTIGAQLDAIVDEDAAELFERVADDRAALRMRMRDALDSLPNEQREVVELAYFEGLTHRVIAERLQVPPGTVKSRLRLAMEKLRDAIGVRRAT